MIKALLEQEQTEHHRVGMGIGLNYVKRMLAFHYEGKASLTVTSELGQGTRIIISIQIGEGIQRNDPCSHRRRRQACT